MNSVFSNCRTQQSIKKIAPSGAYFRDTRLVQSISATIIGKEKNCMSVLVDVMKHLTELHTHLQ